MKTNAYPECPDVEEAIGKISPVLTKYDELANRISALRALVPKLREEIEKAHAKIRPEEPLDQTSTSEITGKEHRINAGQLLIPILEGNQNGLSTVIDEELPPLRKLVIKALHRQWQTIRSIYADRICLVTGAAAHDAQFQASSIGDVHASHHLLSKVNSKSEDGHPREQAAMLVGAIASIVEQEKTIQKLLADSKKLSGLSA